MVVQLLVVYECLVVPLAVQNVFRPLTVLLDLPLQLIVNFVLLVAKLIQLFESHFAMLNVVLVLRYDFLLHQAVKRFHVSEFLLRVL